MKKPLKWAGILLLCVFVLFLISAILVIGRYNSRKDKKYSIDIPPPSIPNDSASIAKGMHFVPVCQSCHGEALEGKLFINDPKIGKIYSPNLTRGRGGVGEYYSDADWIRAIRHGVNPKGNALLIMPSAHFHAMSKEDLFSLIAFLKQIPKVDNSTSENSIPLFTRALLQFGAFGNAFNAEEIKHDAPYPQAPSVVNESEYGAYITEISGCKACHGSNLRGGKSPNPKSPYVPNITRTGTIQHWTSEQFAFTLKTGVSPLKKPLDDAYMPWKHIGQLPEQDLKAIFAYLMTIPNE